MPFEKWKSVKELKVGDKTLNFCHPVPCDLTWAYNNTYFIILNNQTFYSYRRDPEEEITFELWLYGNPKAFSIGGWLKENLTVGSKEDLLVFPSGYKLTVECIQIGPNAAGNIGLYRPDGSYVFSTTGTGVNGVGDVNVNDGIVLWMNSEKKEAVIEFMRSVRTQMTDSWSGSINQPLSIDNVWNETQRKELYTVIEGLLPPDFLDDTSTTGGGDGDWYDDSSDTIGLPDLTLLNQNSISNTKFFSCYKMTPNQLSVLSEHLWTDWRNIAELIGNSILKPLDFVISLNMLPVDVESTQKVIKMGWFDLNHVVRGGLINQQYVRVDCGSITVKKKWGAAIDYQTDVSLFLPFIGEVTLNANEVMGATLTIIYTVDIMSGNCIASVKVVKEGLNAILYQYNGNVASNFSITSLDYSNVMSGALQLAVAVGTGAGRGVGAFTSAVSSTSNLLSGADVRRAGNLSSTSGFMGIKKPYLILSRPIQSLPENYNSYRGFVSNITMKLKDCKGYTQVDLIHIDNVSCMEEEKTRLLQILKDGVII